MSLSRKLSLRRSWRILLVTGALCACSTDVEGKRRTGGDPSTAGPDVEALPDGSTGLPNADGGVDDETSITCLSAEREWTEVVSKYCAKCHGPDSPGEGGFSTILDPKALIASGKVVPFAPGASPLYLKMTTGEMPPEKEKKRPSEADIATIRTWIECGASRTEACAADCTDFVGIDARLSSMLKDVQSFATPEERSDIRYIDLSNYANAGRGERDIQLYREAISYLWNSLSNGPEIAIPEAIDEQKLLFRIRLSDYALTAAAWEKLVAGYPYAIRYDADSRLFPHDDLNGEQLRVETGTQVPYLQADWFFSHASRPPLYYDLLGIPTTLAALEQKLGADIQANIDAELVSRAGFRDSGPSRFNRVIERHSLGVETGVLWLTYDFSAGSGTSNVFSHPLDFVEASTELLFSLPNGMQGYMIVNAAGQRVDKAPNDAVQDPLSRDLAIEAGISCIACHTEAGIIEKGDEIRASTLGGSSDPAFVDAVLALYAEPSELATLYDLDQERYQTARVQAGALDLANGAAHKLDDGHLGLMSLRDVAGVLGLQSGELRAALDSAPGTFPPDIVALTISDEARIARDGFEAVFPALVAALALGEVIDPAP